MEGKNKEPEFKTESHRRNYELAMKERAEQRKRPLDLEATLKRMQENSKDKPTDK